MSFTYVFMYIYGHFSWLFVKLQNDMKINKKPKKKKLKPTNATYKDWHSCNNKQIFVEQF